MRGDLIYRCRMCGQSFTAASVPEFGLFIATTLAGIGAMGLHRMHSHDDHTIGVADLIGGAPTPAPAAPDPEDG